MPNAEKVDEEVTSWAVETVDLVELAHFAAGRLTEAQFRERLSARQWPEDDIRAMVTIGTVRRG